MQRKNFGQNQTLQPSAAYTPADEAEVLRILDQHRGQQVRAVGRLHSGLLAQSPYAVFSQRPLGGTTVPQPRLGGLSLSGRPVDFSNPAWQPQPWLASVLKHRQHSNGCSDARANGTCILRTALENCAYHTSCPKMYTHLLLQVAKARERSGERGVYFGNLCDLGDFPLW